MRTFDFFEGKELVRPTITEEDAEQLANDLFGIRGKARELGSQQDRNFLITDAATGSEYLLKVDNSAFSTRELAAQDAALKHLAKRGLHVPAPIAGINGETLQSDVGVRMMTFLEGPPLAEQGHLAPAVIAAMGKLSATVARELEDFESEGLERGLQWDMRSAVQVVDHLIDTVADEARRKQITSAAATAAERLDRVAQKLRVQPIHGDLTDDNVICSKSEDGRLVPYGVIDFGDLANGWLVAELAVTVSSILHHDASNPLAALHAIKAFHEVVPLTEEEVSALWPLVVLRGAVLVVSGEHQVQLEEGNHYAEERMEGEWTMFESATSVGWAEAEAAIRSALNMRSLPSAPASGSALLEAFAKEDYGVLDFSVTSPGLDDGAWSSAATEWQLAVESLEHHAVAVAPYGQHRLTRTKVNLSSEPATMALHSDIFLTAGTTVFAPTDATVVKADDDKLVLALSAFIEGTGKEEDWELHLTGLTPIVAVGDKVEAGDILGAASDLSDKLPQPGGRHADRRLGRILVQLVAQAGLEAPLFVSQARTSAWNQLAIDPSSIIGLPAAPMPLDPQHELQRRGRIFSGAQERYYVNPPQIERGWQEFLFDTTGRCYLDMVNNVAAIGHSHPRMTEAVSRQLALLNTNSRFLYQALSDLSERLVALAPDPSLDTVLLVNSGTEANDLALRMAQIHTNRRTVLALREAYHGWSMAADAVTTSAYDNPHALATRPDWVEIVDVPNTFRDAMPVGDPTEHYVAQVADRLAELAGADRDVAAFICESVLGNAGGVLLPDGYLKSVYALVRERGGICIADEVQVGYGRLGHHFWGVEQQDAVPDVITIAKAMGNGYPLGAVITRREIADSLAREGNFFSSAGGSPVSCVAGIAVLDVLESEQLQQNARLVGDHLIARLEELAKRHPIIGAVHGLGLYLGVELVRDRATLEPATEETAAICERLLELGVIMQATSERQNVLKVKPPMCLSLESADFFVDRLDEVLTNGW